MVQSAVSPLKGPAVKGFVHEPLPGRIVFGAGSIDCVPEEIEALGCARVLVIAGGSAAQVGGWIADALGRRAAGHLDRVRQHVPETLAAEARAAAEEAGADGLCSVGGGSATGLAKAVAVETGLPILAVPTTYAGSEVTPIYGISAPRFLTGPPATASAEEKGVAAERKRTGRDLRVLPKTVVYDPALTIGLPPRVTAVSGFNALAHAVAALCAPAGNPVAALHAEEAIRVLARALPAAVRAPTDLDARRDALYAAYLAASAMAVAGTGLHHRLCHILGGSFDLVHAEVHAALLPHTVAHDRGLTNDGRRRVARALGAADAAAGLHRLAREVEVPTSLADIGMPADGLEAAGAQAAAALGGSRLRVLLDDAYATRPPSAGEHPTDQGGTT